MCRNESRGSLDYSITYAGRSKHVAVGAFAEVVAGSDITVEIFAEESLKFPLPGLRGTSVSRGSNSGQYEISQGDFSYPRTVAHPEMKIATELIGTRIVAIESCVGANSYK